VASIGHLLFGAALARLHGAGRAPYFLYPALALAPDLDVIAFPLGIPYAAPWGHRGASHSLAIALLVGLVAGALLARVTRTRAWPAVAFAVLAIASHGLFDMLTDGGKGVAYLWPLSAERFFFPVQPIPVAPIGARFFSARGLYCVIVELALFGPLVVLAYVRRPGSSRVQ
jgi:inner membrane protein